MRTRGRDHSQAERRELVTPNTECPFCKSRLWIAGSDLRHVQTLDGLVQLVLRPKRCSSPACPKPRLLYRPPEEGRLVLKAHEFGMDVVAFAGERYLREKLSIPRIHKVLRDERHVPICERSVGNLVDDYVTLCECVAADTDRLRQRFKRQGGIVLSIDGVQYDDRSPVLYVQRDVLSGEVLYAERRLARAAEDLVPMLQRSVKLAGEIGVPILGVVSDKERSLVPAIATAFPGIPHQFCQQHYLGNVAKAMEEDNRRLEEAARDVVTALRDVRRTIERQSAGASRAEERRAAELPGAPTPPSAGGQAGDSVHLAPASGPGPLTTGLSARDPDGGRPAVVEPRAEPGHSGRKDSPALAGSASASNSPETSDEAKIADALAVAGTTVGTVCGRPSVDPAGLKRFERLQGVRAAAERASKKKALRPAAGL